ncbi:restriction endonuclease subunit S [Vibrio fluvialis]|nr:restriction endonuclease subunit S [Vibrio fluvialis]MBY7805054.1 restriction endonuclease subunit S [Vibrio fluvialis]MBY7845351.1 restriction endonuclease subunit S [Vibrio fluvialis]
MSWPTEILSDVCIIQPPKSEIKRTVCSDSLVSFVPMSNLGIGSQSITLSEDKKLSDVSSGYTCFSDKDVLLAKITPCFENGKLGIAKGLTNKVGFGSSEYIVFRPSTKVTSEYLYYFLSQQSFRNEGAKHMKGSVGHKRVSKEFIANFRIPIPAIEIQNKVVTLLDKAFADIDQARANTEQNLQNARELFDSYLQQVFSESGDDWEETNLGAISELKNGLNYTQASKGELVKIVGVKNFKDKFYISNDELETIQIDGTLSGAYHAKDGDIFIVRSNGNKALIGRSVLAKGVTGKVSHSGFTIRVRLSSSAILPSYLTHYLKSKHVHNLLIRSGEGANISSLNQKALASLPVRFPEKNEQLRLVHDIEAIQSKSMALVDVYEQKLAALDELKQSLLQQAFTGQLTQG